MKKLLFIFSLVTSSFILIGCDDDNDEKISVNDLPATAQTFLQTHFPEQEVRHVERDNDSYDVYLSNGFEIEFTLSGEWSSVDGNRQTIPQSIINLLPQAIFLYVTENNPQLHISEVSKEKYGYEIGLSNGLELHFSADGTFLGFDN